MSALVHARIAGGLCALVCAVAVVSGLAGTKGAHLTDIQLGTSVERVRQLVADRRVREPASRAISIDYLFLAAYWAAFVALAGLIWRRGGIWSGVAVLAAATATATAALDVAENVRTTRALAAGAQLGQAQLDGLRRVSLVKWTASATTVGLLAGVFAQHTWAAVLAVVLLVVALVGLAGIVRHDLIRRFFFPGLGLMTIVIAVLLLGWPGAVARHL